jgi:hypothetical protein
MGLLSRGSQSLTPGNHRVLQSSTRQTSKQHKTEALAGFTKRVGFANMHHDGVAKRDLSWAWAEAE